MAVPVPPPPAAVRAPSPAVVHHRDGRVAALVSVYAAEGYVIVRTGGGATLRWGGADLGTLPWGPAPPLARRVEALEASVDSLAGQVQSLAAAASPLATQGDPGITLVIAERGSNIVRTLSALWTDPPERSLGGNLLAETKDVLGCRHYGSLDNRFKLLRRDIGHFLSRFLRLLKNDTAQFLRFSGRVGHVRKDDGNGGIKGNEMPHDFGESFDAFGHSFAHGLSLLKTLKPRISTQESQGKTKATEKEGAR